VEGLVVLVVEGLVVLVVEGLVVQDVVPRRCPRCTLAWRWAMRRTTDEGGTEVSAPCSSSTRRIVGRSHLHDECCK